MIQEISGTRPEGNGEKAVRWDTIYSALRTAGVVTLWSVFEGKGIRKAIIGRFMDANPDLIAVMERLRNERNRYRAHLDNTYARTTIKQVDQVIAPNVRVTGWITIISGPSSYRGDLGRFIDLAQRYRAYLHQLLAARYIDEHNPSD